MLLPICKPPVAVKTTPESIVMLLCRLSTPVPLELSSISPEPEVKILMFWFEFAETWIVPELSDNTCCPLTYNDHGPTYTSFQTFVALPKVYVLLLAGIKLPAKFS